MKNNKNYLKKVLILSLLLVFSFVNLSYGNSAEPPSILIIVPNAPDDLNIKVLAEGDIRDNVVDKVIEKHYIFYASSMIKKTNRYDFVVSSGDKSFNIELDKPAGTYNNIYTLDLNTKSLTEGKLLSRSITLVGLRIILTLIIEATIFWIYGFRNKKSWIAFLIINLITQGALNIWINSMGPIMSCIFFVLVFGEFFVFIAELIAFSIFCKEHSKLRKIMYVLTANLVSLIVGGYIITILPI